MDCEIWNRNNSREFFSPLPCGLWAVNERWKLISRMFFGSFLKTLKVQFFNWSKWGVRIIRKVIKCIKFGSTSVSEYSNSCFKNLGQHWRHEVNLVDGVPLELRINVVLKCKHIIRDEKTPTNSSSTFLISFWNFVSLFSCLSCGEVGQKKEREKKMTTT